MMMNSLDKLYPSHPLQNISISIEIKVDMSFYSQITGIFQLCTYLGACFCMFGFNILMFMLLHPVYTVLIGACLSLILAAILAEV